MTEIILNTWNEFRFQIDALQKKHGELRRNLPDNKVYIHPNEILFRGQADHTWQIQTTLERRARDCIQLQRYVVHANACVNELESFTGKRWNVKPFPELMSEIRAGQDDFHVHLPAYDYLVYLRHHGFPSPLLDWTTSPYIAAYFAFIDADSSKRVAIYAYVPTDNEGGHGSSSGDRQISVLGKYTTTDTRHFAQKARYTIATKWDDKNKQHDFCPHVGIFKDETGSQDILYKITLPTTERVAALRALDDFNINHYTLYNTEDAIVRTVAVRQFDLNAHGIIVDSVSPDTTKATAP